MNAKELKCFTHVASVIGEEAATIELQKMLDHGTPFTNEATLDGCFSWADTDDIEGQGFDFWCDIFNTWIDNPDLSAEDIINLYSLDCDQSDYYVEAD